MVPARMRQRRWVGFGRLRQRGCDSEGGSKGGRMGWAGGFLGGCDSEGGCGWVDGVGGWGGCVGSWAAGDWRLGRWGCMQGGGWTGQWRWVQACG